MLDVEFQSHCGYDALTLSGSGDPVTLCGDNSDLAKCTYVVRGNTAHVRFTTDGSVTGEGFRITYIFEEDKDQATENCEQRKYRNRSFKAKADTHSYATDKRIN